MLSLDDPLWAELHHAYGAAADVPNLLRQLRSSTGPHDSAQSEPWFSLWSSLCHQGDVYTASYAAVPHVVSIATETPSPIDCSFFLMPVAVEVARETGRGPDVPVRLAEAYRRALASLGEAVSLHLNEPWDQSMLLSATAALAVAKGQVDVAEVIMNLDEDQIHNLIKARRS